MFTRQEDSADTPPAVWLRHLGRKEAPDAAEPLPRKIGLRASISEFLLVTRLRACNLLGRRGHVVATSDADQAAVMARFAHILSVTCKHWFPRDTLTNRPHQTQL